MSVDESILVAALALAPAAIAAGARREIRERRERTALPARQEVDRLQTELAAVVTKINRLNDRHENVPVLAAGGAVVLALFVIVLKVWNELTANPDDDGSYVLWGFAAPFIAGGLGFLSFYAASWFFWVLIAVATLRRNRLNTRLQTANTRLRAMMADAAE